MNLLKFSHFSHLLVLFLCLSVWLPRGCLSANGRKVGLSSKPWPYSANQREEIFSLLLGITYRGIFFSLAQTKCSSWWWGDWSYQQLSKANGMEVGWLSMKDTKRWTQAHHRIPWLAFLRVIWCCLISKGMHWAIIRHITPGLCSFSFSLPPFQGYRTQLQIPRIIN